MKKYMVLYWDEDGSHAWFTDSQQKADAFMMDASCGLGAAVQLYGLTEDEEIGEKYYELLL